MKVKISILWLFLAVGFIIHHMYMVYYNESTIIDGANIVASSQYHFSMFFFEGIAFVFSLLVLEITKLWFKIIALVFAVVLVMFNLYCFVSLLIYEPINIIGVVILVWILSVNVFLVKALNRWRKQNYNRKIYYQ